MIKQKIALIIVALILLVSVVSATEGNLAGDAGNYCLVAEHDGQDWFGCAASATGIGLKLGIIGKAFKWVKPTTEANAYFKTVEAIKSNSKFGDDILNGIDINNDEKLATFFKLNSHNPDFEADLVKTQARLTNLLKQNRRGLDAIGRLQKESPDALKGIRSAEDLESAAKGADKVLKNIREMEKVAPGLSDAQKVEFLKNVGKISSKAADNVAYISDVKGVNNIAHDIATANEVAGFEFEAEMATKLRARGEKLEEVSQQIKPKGYRGTNIDARIENGDIYEAKNIDWDKNPGGSDGYNGLKQKLGDQISQFRAFQQENGFTNSKITVVFKGSVEPGIEDWLKNTKNVLVEVLP